MTFIFPGVNDIGENKYSITTPVDPGVAEYKFRINGDWATSEFPDGGANRMAWATQSPITLSHVYNDYNPNTWPVTLNVDMNTEITEELKEKANQLYSWQSDKEVRALYDRYKKDPLIRWKGDIKTVVGLPIGKIGSDE